MSEKENSLIHFSGEEADLYVGVDTSGKKAVLVYDKNQDSQVGSMSIKPETKLIESDIDEVTINIPNGLRKAGMVGLAALSTVVPGVAAAEGVGEVNTVMEKIDFNSFGGVSASDYAFILKEAGATNDTAVNLASKVLYTWDHIDSGELDDKYHFTNYGEYLEIVRYAIEGKSDNVLIDKNGNHLSYLFRFDERLKSNLYRALDWMEENGVGDAPLNLSKLGIGVFFAAVTQPEKSFDATWINKSGELSFNIGPENIGSLSDDDIRDTFVKAILSGVVASYDNGDVAHLPMDNDLNTILEKYKSLFGEKMEGIEGGTVDFSSKYLSFDYTENTTKEFMSYQTPEPTPVPTERVRNVLEAWRDQIFSPYRKELKDLGAENESRIDFGSRMLYAYDYSKDMKGGNESDKFQNYISRQEIVDYVLGGENDDVLCNEAGEPRLWLVNMNDDMKEACKGSFSWFKKNKAPDAMDSIYNNGACVIFTTLTDPDRGPGSVLLTEFGVISPNMTPDNIKQYKNKNALMTDFARMEFVESYGIAYWQVMKFMNISSFDKLGNMEVVKSLIAATVSKDLGYKDLYKHFNGVANDFAKLYKISLKDPLIKRQLQLLADLIKPVGLNSLRDSKSFVKTAGLSVT